MITFNDATGWNEGNKEIMAQRIYPVIGALSYKQFRCRSQRRGKTWRQRRDGSSVAALTPLAVKVKQHGPYELPKKNIFSTTLFLVIVVCKGKDNDEAT